jgi:hypothetical protein
MIRPRPPLMLALLLAASLRCVLPNPDHCYNLALDSHGWCSAQYGEDRPYCSPCAAEHNGCVSEEPSQAECSQYSPPPPSETETGETETGETETGETETG